MSEEQINERTTLLEFPTDFPLKIMGNNHPDHGRPQSPRW